MRLPYFVAKDLIEYFDKHGEMNNALFLELRETVDNETRWRKGPGMATPQKEPKPKSIDELIDEVGKRYNCGQIGAQKAFNEIFALAKRQQRES